MTSHSEDATMGTCVVITQQCRGWVTFQSGGLWGKNPEMRVPAQEEASNSSTDPEDLLESQSFFFFSHHSFSETNNWYVRASVWKVLLITNVYVLDCQ